MTDFPAWAQAVAAVLGVPSVIVSAVIGSLQFASQRRDRLPILEPKGEARWSHPQYKDNYVLYFEVDIRNTTNRAFIINGVSLRNPEPATISYPINGKASKNSELQLDLDCPPGVTSLELMILGKSLASASSVSMTFILSSKSGDILRKTRVINAQIQKINERNVLKPSLKIGVM